MTPQQLQELQEQYQQARDHYLTMKARNVDQGTLSAAIEKAMNLKQRLDSARSDSNMLAELDRLTVGMTSATSTSRGGRGGGSIGQQIINSELGQWLVANRGKFPSGTWQSPVSSEVGFDLHATTLDESSGSGGQLVTVDYQRGILPLPLTPLTIADLMAPGTTTSNSVGYMKETTATNAAATVAEGAPKPESTLVFTAVTDPVRKIATWIPVTDELLEDVPAMQAYLDARLRLFVQIVEDDQLLNGDGTAPNISGILDRPAIATPIARVAETNPDVILKQINAIETATRLPVDGIVMHPTNWNNILLLKDANGAYVAGGGPFATPQRKTLWGRNVAVTPAVTANTAVVGAFKTASQFFRRGALRVEASNSHSDFFVKNLIAIRAEERGALCVYRENAFGKVTNLT